MQDLPMIIESDYQIRLYWQFINHPYLGMWYTFILFLHLIKKIKNIKTKINEKNIKIMPQRLVGFL